MTAAYDRLREDFATGLVAEGVRPLEEYRTRPVAFLADVLGIPERRVRWSLNPGYGGHRWDGTPDPLVAALEALAAGLDVGVESGAGTGKTYNLGAGATLWFVGCWRDALVVTTAPTQPALKRNLWKELRELWPAFKSRFPRAELTTLRLLVAPERERRRELDTEAPQVKWGAMGFTTGAKADEKVATAAQGTHAEHMLQLFEEMPGVPVPTANAFEQSRSAPHNLALGLGNPDHEQDALHLHCVAEGVVHIRISAHDHPNVVCRDASIVPGAISREKVLRLRRKWGPSSRLYRSRVRGICPSEASDALIRRAWVRDALARDPSTLPGWPFREGALGVDVARSPNGDRAVVAAGRGPVLDHLVASPCDDPNEYARGVVLPLLVSRGIRDERCGVDVVGVGAGTVDELKRLGRRVVAIQSGGSRVQDPDNPDVLLVSRRALMWWTLANELRRGEIALALSDADPDIVEELVDDLLAPATGQRAGQVWVEDKASVAARLGRSTDLGDGVVYWNWVRRPRELVVATAGGSVAVL